MEWIRQWNVFFNAYVLLNYRQYQVITPQKWTISIIKIALDKLKNPYVGIEKLSQFYFHKDSIPSGSEPCWISFDLKKFDVEKIITIIWRVSELFKIKNKKKTILYKVLKRKCDTEFAGRVCKAKLYAPCNLLLVLLSQPKKVLSFCPKKWEGTIICIANSNIKPYYEKYEADKIFLDRDCDLLILPPYHPICFDFS